MNPPAHESEYDYLILGGGTAGCVLAARLSGHPNLTVCLVEAGPDLPPGSEPASIRDPFPSSVGDARFFWPDLMAEVGADPGDGRPRLSRAFLQGRCIGGSSSVMGMMATRGLPRDYDEWRDRGAQGWGWSDVAPYFRACECDLDFSGSAHGADGPLPVRRYPRAAWPPFCRALAELMEADGHPYWPDFNDQSEDGVSCVPMNNLPDRRVSVAMAYLTREVRRRRNLCILPNCTTEILTFEGARATGARVRTPCGVRHLKAREIVVSSGALHTPAVLMRSGIGPAKMLQALAIPVLADLPGVGQNLLNHPCVSLAVDLQRAAWQDTALRSWGFSVLRYSSRYRDCPLGDMQLHPMNKTAWHPLGRRVGSIGVSVFKSFSQGAVTLQSSDPRAPPIVRMNLLDDPRDFERLVAGTGFALSLLQHRRIRGLRNEVFLPSGYAMSLNRLTTVNYLKSGFVRQLFALSGHLRRRVLKPGLIDVPAVVGDEASLRALVRRAAAPVHHVCGTCRMGAGSDRMAVLDSDLRVFGVRGLRVIDASVMPTIVSANTHLTVVMIAEKAAQSLLREVRAPTVTAAMRINP